MNRDNFKGAILVSAIYIAFECSIAGIIWFCFNGPWRKKSNEKADYYQHELDKIAAKRADQVKSIKAER